MTAHNSLTHYVRCIHSGKNISFFLISSLLLCIFQLIQFFITDLSFNRIAISNYEIWRLISGGLVHANELHLLLNILGLFCLLMLYELQIKVIIWCFVSLSLVFSINAILYLFLPSTIFYLGFSGALHGLFVWYSIQEWRRKHSWYPALVMLLLITKLSLDVLLTDSFSSHLIGMRVHWQAHWIGAFLGGFLSFITKNKTA